LQPAAVEWVVWIHSIIKNKPNFPHFSTENKDFTKKQTQFKANQTQNKANSKPILAPNRWWQTQFKPKQIQYKPIYVRD
jgi:hypothetical protein